jgi:hypothetical protein
MFFRNNGHRNDIVLPGCINFSIWFGLVFRSTLVSNCMSAFCENSNCHASWSTIKGIIYRGRMKTIGIRDLMLVFAMVT